MPHLGDQPLEQSEDRPSAESLKSHETLIIEIIRRRLVPRLVTRGVRRLAPINNVDRHLAVIRALWPLPSIFELLLHPLHAFMRDVEGMLIRDGRAITCSRVMTLTEVGVKSYVEIHAPKCC